jgi:hypothetical protein
MCKYVSYILKVDKNLNKGINQFSKMTKKKKKTKKTPDLTDHFAYFCKSGGSGPHFNKALGFTDPSP